MDMGMDISSSVKKLKQLIQGYYPQRTRLQQEQKKFLLEHLDTMNIHIHKDKIQKLEKALTTSKEEGIPNTQQIVRQGKGMIERHKFQQAIFSLSPQTDPQKRMITFLYSIPYPCQRFQDQDTKGIVETFIKHPTMRHAGVVKTRFKQKQRQQQQKQQQNVLIEKLLDEYFESIKQEQEQEQR